MSNGTAYYDYLAKSSTPIEVFAYAAGGYGTVQQSLVLEKYIPLISPDLILWQFTGNDFINNDWLLESQSPENSSHMYRPFFENGKIVYRHPDGTMGMFAEYSLLFRRFLVIRGSFRKRTIGSIEDKLHLEHPSLERSLVTTRLIIENISRKYTNIPILAFFAGKQYYSWELPAFAFICENTKLNCVESVPIAVNMVSQNGEKVDGGNDGHWNETGHEIAGRILTEVVIKRIGEVR